jgi:hypothetical protein
MEMIWMGCYRVTSIMRRRKVKKVLGRRSIASFKELQPTAVCCKMSTCKWVQSATSKIPVAS